MIQCLLLDRLAPRPIVESLQDLHVQSAQRLAFLPPFSAPRTASRGSGRPTNNSTNVRPSYPNLTRKLAFSILHTGSHSSSHAGSHIRTMYTYSSSTATHTFPRTLAHHTALLYASLRSTLTLHPHSPPSLSTLTLRPHSTLTPHSLRPHSTLTPQWLEWQTWDGRLLGRSTC